MPMPRLKEQYRNEVVPALVESFGYQNVMQAPRLDKIVVNVGAGEALQNAKALDAIVEDLRVITGQQPIITRARKSIATYKLRAGRQSSRWCSTVSCWSLSLTFVSSMVCSSRR